MKCPQDNAELFSQEYESGIFVSVCTLCRGIWTDLNELKKIEVTHERSHEEELRKIPDLVGNAIKKARQKMVRNISCPMWS